MQHAPSAHALLVIPIYHQRLFRKIYRIVRPVTGKHHAAPAEFSRQLRIRRQQRLIVLQFQIKHILRLLDIRYARLPKQVQHIHGPNRNISQSAKLLLVPVHAPHACTLLHLLPAGIGVDLFKIVLLQNARND